MNVTPQTQMNRECVMCIIIRVQGVGCMIKHQKKDWLKDKTIYASVNGNDTSPLCGANETFPCLTVKKAFEMCEVQISLTITLMEGDHQSETTTIEIGTKEILVIGKGKDKSSIGTGALSSPSAAGTLFSVTTGHLGLLHIKVGCNSNTNPSPSVIVVFYESGSFSLEDVVITASVSSGNAIYSSVLKVQLSQLSMIDVEITKKNISKSLFSELDQSFLFSSSVLFFSLIILGDSVLENVKAKNVKFTSGDGMVAAKAVEAGKSFAIQSARAKEGQNLCALERGDSAINFCLFNF
ncbi:uncharacterized protein MONOS_415 [Monocercomonoides exilis]|uniref:uncharacterized protein n=1 Tax=Monocercomonoides exilis TaxID=2049356 RepID=UPI00355A1982|nr:hypothetical protein MONOS_415 [Monocercomonoides exilis]|eukprot:MONOS_415.1-p1 / transcript=MONOS_415.1 / gene=MONOS_415 / organism=Monocercomonoides_exilis_PA203 / gene_product=unspecified product / transcript_product=unspecified product / location=Mono_scaffold00006:305499-306383(+) / protein_length=295 / sequence_SO=supercontig / SO=protein_coding / is_pseudo=false